jgi:hypothetical protein
MTRKDKYNNKPDAPRIPKINITKKHVVIVLSLFIGLMVSGIIGMIFFDTPYTEDQLLTIAIQDKYPLQSDLQAALDSGEILPSELSNELQAYMHFYDTEFEFDLKDGFDLGNIED